MQQKIAVISDSHGNATALQAAISDALKRGADEFWSLGDMVVGGGNSEECMQILDQINLTQVLLGNWEDNFNLELIQPNYDIKHDPLAVYFTMLAKYDSEHLSQKHQAALKKLPMTGHKEVGPLVFSLTHNLPDQNHGHTLYPDQAQVNFNQLALDQDIDVAIFAHIHSPLWRYTSSGQIILNPGSVGRPWDPRAKLLQNRAASYVLLTISENGLDDVDFRRASYDPEIELKKAADNGFPYVDLERKLLITGNSSSHNGPLLEKINAERGYNDEAAEFLAQLKTKLNQ